MFISLKFYEILSSSIYKNSNAILTAGKIIPVKGTKIDGRYDAVIYLFCKKFNMKFIYNIIVIIRYFS